LTTLSKNVIAKEQDRVEVIKVYARLIHKLGKLYMIPGWSEDQAVLLAEWTLDNYGCEDPELVIKCLSNPPSPIKEGDKNWRITPDNIREWMTPVLEDAAESREKEYDRIKKIENDSWVEPVKDVNYAEYLKRVEDGTHLREVKSDPWLKGDDAYSRFKAQRALNNPPQDQKAEGNEPLH